MNFEFITAQRIIFGPDSIYQLPSLIPSGKGLLVTGRRQLPADLIKKIFPNREFLTLKISGEPEVTQIQEAARQITADFVISIGGGSVIDAGKAIAALLANNRDIYDYLEIIGKGLPIENPPLPFIAIPTTAGSGAEVTRNAVLRDSSKGVKASLRSPMMLPKAAIIDPKLSLSLPPETTAATGMDALTQVIEPFVSKKANPLTDALCREGITRAAKSLQVAYKDPANLEARSDMALASLIGGLALANAGLGAVHGFAAPIGGMFNAPHGAVCAALLGPVFSMNAKKNHSPRFAEVAKLLTGNADVGEAIQWLNELTNTLNIPKLSPYGITAGACDDIIDKAKNSSSMKGNPSDLSDDDLREIFYAAL